MGGDCSCHRDRRLVAEQALAWRAAYHRLRRESGENNGGIQSISNAGISYQLARDDAQLCVLTVGALMMIVNFNLLMTPAMCPRRHGRIVAHSQLLHRHPARCRHVADEHAAHRSGFLALGRFRFLVRTLYVTIIYTIGVDLTARFFPAQGIVDDLLLTALFGGVLGGIGYGLVVHGRGMVSGTGIISRVIQLRTGIPLSQLYVFIDGFVIIALGLTFGWERALYGPDHAVCVGLASDYVLEGPSVVRVVFIVTDLPEAVGAVLMERLRVGVTRWVGEGMYTHETRAILFLHSRPAGRGGLEFGCLEIDPDAFVVIGQGPSDARRHGASAGFRQAAAGRSGRRIG